MHMLAANILFAKNLLFLCVGEEKYQETKWPSQSPVAMLNNTRENVCRYSIVQQKLCIICFDQLRDTYS